MRNISNRFTMDTTVLNAGKFTSICIFVQNSIYRGLTEKQNCEPCPEGVPHPQYVQLQKNAEVSCKQMCQNKRFFIKISLELYGLLPQTNTKYIYCTKFHKNN